MVFSRAYLSFLPLCMVVLFSTSVLSQVPNYAAPDWSPDGNAMVFTSTVSGNSEIYIRYLNTKETIQITNTDSTEWTPAWSPDGESIVFVSDRSGNKELYLYSIENKTEKRLTETATDEVAPSWLPNSESIAYVETNFTERTQKVYLMDIDSRKAKVFLSDSNLSYIYPRYSFDGKMMVAGVRENKPGELFHVWTMDDKGESAQQVESLEGVSYNPNWFPDGKRIVFIHQGSRDLASAAIYVMNKDGSEIRKLVECEGGCFQARVSPDGKSMIYKNGWVKNHKGIFMYSFEDKKETKVVG